MTQALDQQHVVVLGGGFAGLYAAKALAKGPVQVILVDKRNFHLFQPLLYQVATGEVSPGDITYPLRSVVNRHKNIRVLKAEAIDLLPDQNKVILRDGELSYDTLILATGASNFYFGKKQWELLAPGLKTIEDALEMRRRILEAFEHAEREADPEKQRAWMRFIVVGGGPTGVELCGALGELAHDTLKDDFRHIDPTQAEIILVEGLERILPSYPPELSNKAHRGLVRLGVTVRTKTRVDEIRPEGIRLQTETELEEIQANTVLWAAGMKASGLGEILAARANIELDRLGRVVVTPDLSVPGYPNIFVIGDLAHFRHQTGEPLPAVAPVAMQQGQYVAKLIMARLKGKDFSSFHYRNKGNLAVIGRNAAIADFGFMRLAGFLAWVVWVFVHIAYLIEFDNKLRVLIQWAWTYFTRKRGARLITEPQER